MLQNKQSNRHSLYSMTGVVVLFALSYPVEYFNKQRSYKNSRKETIMLFQLIFPKQSTTRFVSQTFYLKWSMNTTFNLCEIVHAIPQKKVYKTVSRYKVMY